VYIISEKFYFKGNNTDYTKNLAQTMEYREGTQLQQPFASEQKPTKIYST